MPLRLDFTMLYARLDFLSYEIRLLSIQEALIDEPICCTLEQTTLIDPGSYHALSYCWGDLRNKKRIIINDVSVEVGHNLEAALRQLRSRGYLRVWIDALCINQDDVEERGLQIRNMRQIYSQAVYVILWLGDDPDNIADAVKYLFEHGRYRWFPGRRFTAVGGLMPCTRGRDKEKQEEWDVQRWRIFQSFFEISYWRRVWVIQEIASSGRVKVLFGQIAMDWKSITDAISHWKEYSDAVPKACASYKYAAELDYFRTRFKDPRQMTLIEAFQRSYYALATDQRDKIYALLGLTSDGPRLVPMPNYQKTFEQVLCDLIRAILAAENSSNTLTPMSFSGGSQRGWPWLDAKALQLWSNFNTILGSPFCSWNPMFSHIPMQRAPNTKGIHAQGLFLGQVCQISSHSFHSDISASQPKLGRGNIQCEMANVIPSNLDLYPSGLPAAILHTLCLCQSASAIDPELCLNNLWSPKGRKRVPVSIGLGLKDNREQWDHINHWLRSNSSLRVGSSTLQQWAQSNSTTKYFKYLMRGPGVPFPNEEFGYCIEAVDKVLRSEMCFMVTQTGLIGMAPPTMQIGDWVCYVKGFSIPVILRKYKMAFHSTDEDLFVVGGAYVHMDGKLPGKGDFGDWAETYFMDRTGLQTIVLG